MQLCLGKVHYYFLWSLRSAGSSFGAKVKGRPAATNQRAQGEIARHMWILATYIYIYIYHFIICPQSKLYTICTYMLNFKCIDNLHQDFRRFSYIYIGSPYLKTNAEPKINWWPIARSAYADGCLSLGSHCILDYFKILRLLGSNGSYRPGLWKWTIQVNLCKTWYPFKLVESHGVASII
jgi:hypothetical protein